MKLGHGTSMILGLILAISFVLIISLLVNLSPDISDTKMIKWIDANLYWSYFLVAVTVIAVVVFEIINILSNRKTARKSLIGVGILGFILLISYWLSDTEMPRFFGTDKFIETGTVNPTMLFWIGVGLIASYLLFAISVIAIFWSAIIGFFK